MESFVKDTTSFINKTDEIRPVSENNFFVYIDMKSLCTNILHQEGLLQILHQKNENTFETIFISLTVILFFWNLILTHNNFTYNAVDYLHINGCIITTKCSPPYLSLYHVCWLR